jgi:hypothetical protein
MLFPKRNQFATTSRAIVIMPMPQALSAARVNDIETPELMSLVSYRVC